MKVAIAGPPSSLVVNGGVRNQITQTIRHLRELGVECETVSHQHTVQDITPDLVHVFTSGRETHDFILQAKKLDLPVILSPVYYTLQRPSSIRMLLKAEAFLQLVSSAIWTDFGVRSSSCALADLILPNTRAEKELLHSALGVPQEKMKVVPNGVEERFQHASPELFSDTYGRKDFVLFAGQSSAPRKNLRGLIEALKGQSIDLVIIGSPGVDQFGMEIRQLTHQNDRILVIPTLSQDSEMLASAYAACHTFVLPSLFETPGIAAMEAALAGANIVITRYGGTREYFLHHAEYIDPHSTHSILQGITASLKKQKNDQLKQHLLTNYTWEKVGRKTLECYEEIVSG